jgi:hypothetical protein
MTAKSRAETIRAGNRPSPCPSTEVVQAPAAASGGPRSPWAPSPWQLAQLRHRPGMPPGRRARSRCPGPAPPRARWRPARPGRARHPGRAHRAAVGHAPAEVALRDRGDEHEHLEDGQHRGGAESAAPGAGGHPDDGGKHDEDGEGDPEPDVNRPDAQSAIPQHGLGPVRARAGRSGRSARCRPRRRPAPTARLRPRARPRSARGRARSAVPIAGWR